MDESLSVQMVREKIGILWKKQCHFGGRMENIMKKYDVVALGELLIDFTENGKSNQGNPLLRQIREERHAMYLQC